MIWGIIGIPFSLSILAMWYCETYTDSQFGQNARFIGSATRMSNKSQSIGTLATGSTFLVGSIMLIDDEGRFPQFIQLILLVITLTIIITGLVWYFSPIPVPRWADARYQYMKRHGMLDKNGYPLPQFDVPEDAEDPTTNDHSEDAL